VITQTHTVDQIRLPMLLRIKLKGLPSVVLFLLSNIRTPKLEKMHIWIEGGCELQEVETEFSKRVSQRFPTTVQYLSTLTFTSDHSSPWWVLDRIYALFSIPDLRTLQLQHKNPRVGPTLLVFPSCFDQFRPRNLALDGVELWEIAMVLSRLDLQNLEILSCIPEHFSDRDLGAPQALVAPKLKKVSMEAPFDIITRVLNGFTCLPSLGTLHIRGSTLPMAQQLGSWITLLETNPYLPQVQELDLG
jgi:hypothetical protein